MKARLLEILRCPECGSPFRVQEGDGADGDLLQGTLICQREHRYPVRAGIPRVVATGAYAESFGFQWKAFARTQLDVARGGHESERLFLEKTGLSLNALPGRLILDAGVGAGRFTEVASRAGAEVVGVDLSGAVDAAYANVGTRHQVHLVQADLFGLPFAPETFDAIFSIGVLHHTPDPRAAFERLVPLLKPGGEIAVWVYDSYHIYRVADGLRRITTRLPHALLYYLCSIAVPLYYLVPLRGLLFHILRVAMHPDARERWLDTFDWYSPRYQWKHGYHEVFEWFAASGLQDITPLAHPVSMRGRKRR